MDLYGSDKPDIRFDMKIVDLSHIAKDCNFKVFGKAVEKGGAVRALNIKGGNSFTRNEIDELTDYAVDQGAQGMAWIGIEPDGKLRTLLTKFLSGSDVERILQAVKGQPGDLIVFCADQLDVVYKTLGNLRLFVGEKLGLRKKDDYKFLIVTDFPLLEWSGEEKRYVAMHHPFTMPVQVDKFLQGQDLDRLNAKSYDFVLNGIELGSGSIRIHRDDIQKKMFEVLGLSQDQIKDRFGFILQAFSYGTPPHGGFAFGLDRLVMIMTGADNIRDVIAFPKTREATDLLSEAPSMVSQEQLDILNLSLGHHQSGSDRQRTPAKRPTYNLKHLADLSKLNIKAGEEKTIKEELESLIQSASKLKNLDTDGVQPMIYLHPIENATRADEIEMDFTSEELLRNAPTKEDGYIVVPKVIE